MEGHRLTGRQAACAHANNLDACTHVLLIVLQAVPGWQLLVLKLLSLQGGKETCNLCELAVVRSTADAEQQACPAAAQQQQQSMSQMDELRLLNESVAKQGELDAAASTCCAEQLILDKAYCCWHAVDLL
jgi:hypothetical protein